MPSFAEIMMQQAGDASKTVGQGMAQSFATGAQLAMEQERVAQGRQHLEIQRQQLDQAKLAKFAEAVEKGQAYAGKAQKNYYDKFLPAFRDSLGLTDKFNDATLQFMTASPENLGRVRTLIADVRSGHKTEQEAIAVLSDPVAMADIPVTSDTYKTLGEAAKTAIENKQELRKQGNQITATAEQAATNRKATGQVELDKKMADEYAGYVAGGGKAKVEKNLELLSGAVTQLKALPEAARSGGKSGLIGDTAMEIFNPEAASIRDDIRGAIQGTLKEVLGSQFTEKEGERIFNRAYNPKLSNKENARRVQVELEALKRMKEQKDSATAYFEANRTMEGYAAPAQASKTAPPPPFDPANAKKLYAGMAKDPVRKAKFEQFVLQKYGQAALDALKGP